MSLFSEDVDPRVLLTAVLELVACERNDLVDPLVELLLEEKTADVAAELARAWDLEDNSKYLPAIVHLSNYELKSLEERRGTWTRDDVELSQNAAVRSFALARSERVSRTRAERLKRIARKLEA